MSEFKGTKGKWVSAKNSAYYEINTDYDSRGLSFNIMLFDNQSGDNLSFSEENKANALLISKAPEMLEMLTMVREGINTMDFYKLETLYADIDQLIQEATSI